MYAVGLMSGTSLDGLDAVLCQVDGVDETTSIRQCAFETFSMPPELKERIRRACSRELVPVDLICSLNFEIGQWFAEGAKKLCDHAGIASHELSFIASHGQTIFHIPKARDGYVASTLQLGEAAVIAEACQCMVISNFRVMDMAVGGEGAPLVPYSEYLLYRHPEQAVALQNIGGIGNVTLLPAACEIDQVLAFDTGPGNMMIDEAMQVLYGCPYDQDGQVARQGQLIVELQEELKSHPYLRLTPPKTTGREDFGAPYTRQLIEKYSNEAPADIVATLTWFTAYCIAYHYCQYILPKYPLKECVVAGGGAYNPCLLHYLRKELPQIDVLTQEDKGYSSEAKEAIAFVILGNQTYHRRPSNVPSATGASRPAVLGQVTYSS